MIEFLKNKNLMREISSCKLDKPLLEQAVRIGGMSVLGGNFIHDTEIISKTPALEEWLKQYDWVPERSQKNRTSGIRRFNRTFALSIFLNPKSKTYIESLDPSVGKKVMDTMFSFNYCSMSDHIMRLLSHYDSRTNVDNEAASNFAVAIIDLMARGDEAAVIKLQKSVPPLMLFENCAIDPSKIFWGVGPFIYQSLIDKGIQPENAIDATLEWSSARVVVGGEIDADFPGLANLRDEWLGNDGGWYLQRGSETPTNQLSADLGNQIADQLVNSFVFNKFE